MVERRPRPESQGGPKTGWRVKRERRPCWTHHSPDSDDPSASSMTLSTRSVLEPMGFATAASNLRPSLQKSQADGIFAGASAILVLTGVRSPKQWVGQQAGEEQSEHTMSDEHLYLFKLKGGRSNRVVLDVQRNVTEVVVRPGLRHGHHF